MVCIDNTLRPELITLINAKRIIDLKRDLIMKALSTITYKQLETSNSFTVITFAGDCYEVVAAEIDIDNDEVIFTL